MADEINAGDWIIVKKQKDFKVKDVVTYMQDGEFITHRIVDINDNYEDLHDIQILLHCKES